MASSLNTAAREAADRFATAFEVPARTEPFRHFILDRLLPEPILDAVAAHRIDRPVAGDTGGRRETENSLRRFVTPTLRTADPAFAALAAALQHESVVTILAERCRAALDGTKLRIEYCADGAGFWLEPHTDIAAKRLTLLIYLNSPPRGEDWGTDLYNGDLSLAGRHRLTPMRASPSCPHRIPGMGSGAGRSPACAGR